MITKQNAEPDFSRRKNCISLLEYSEEELDHIITMAVRLKRQRGREDTPVLKNKTGVLIFEKPSLRTHISFETALFELGGHPIVLHSNMVQMGKRETVKDVAKNLERLVHLVIARTYLHETIVELAAHSSIPVINALSDKFHPCQALAFALTLHEHRGQEKTKKVVFIGDGNNVCHSLMVVCAKRGYHFTAACPRGYEPDTTITETCRSIALRNGCSIEVCNDPNACVADATVIYTDVWASMGQESEAEERKNSFATFQVNESLLRRAPSDVLVSHCLPAHRGEEITSAVLDSANSIALDEAENRLHVQKAVIVHLFS
jgi:ornithine carbamoyltransferase